jgi:large subunit ribosomal protein L29
MKIAEIRELSTKELNERIEVDFFTLYQKRINHSISPLSNSSQLKKMRKTIARLKTELHQRKLNSN